MADIIDFRAKSKPYRTQSKTKNQQTEFGQIILFSGVRIERDEVPDINTRLTIAAELLSSQSN